MDVNGLSNPMKTIIFFLVVAMAILLPGCTNRLADGYDVGDITIMAVQAWHNVKKAQTIYCTATTEEQRAPAIAVLTSLGVDYTADGFCGIDITIDVPQ